MTEPKRTRAEIVAELDARRRTNADSAKGWAVGGSTAHAHYSAAAASYRQALDLLASETPDPRIAWAKKVGEWMVRMAGSEDPWDNHDDIRRFAREWDALDADVANALLDEKESQMSLPGDAIMLTRGPDGSCEVSLCLDDGSWLVVIQDSGELISHIVERAGVFFALGKHRNRLAMRALLDEKESE